MAILAGAMIMTLVSCNSMDTPNFTKKDDAKILDYMKFANKMLAKHGKDRESREKYSQLVEKEF
jgi:hypothetical protein